MSQLTPAPAGMTVRFASGGAALPVVALVIESGYPDDTIRAVAVKDGRLQIAPANATIA